MTAQKSAATSLLFIVLPPWRGYVVGLAAAIKLAAAARILPKKITQIDSRAAPPMPWAAARL
jgi:hypothetical protein